MRPAFGSGEDWNYLITETSPAAFGQAEVAPGLRVGRGLELIVVVVVVVLIVLRPAFGSGEDWNIFKPLGDSGTAELRPAFGSGEDWNLPLSTALYICRASLRPAFGSGEDWNITEDAGMTFKDWLRPAFGSGEDWNSRAACCSGVLGFAAPGLRAGRGSKTGRWLRLARMTL